MSITRKLHEKIHALLRIELEELLVKLPFEEGIEKCFVVAGNYWNEVKVMVMTEGFESTCEEIFFFKVIKPLFTSELEYYSLVYHSVLFCPAFYEAELQFWKREGKRLEEFRRQHKEFLEYYESGKSSLDHFYFTRVKEDDPIPEDVNSYDMEPRTRSNYDPLITKLKALERYLAYTQAKLAGISK